MATQTSASAVMPTVERMSSVAAASAIGTRSRAANGFWTPPVSARR